MNSRLKRPQPFTLVIFGASGDLTRRKLAPAMFNLAAGDHLPEFRIIGFARRERTDEQFREDVHKAIRQFSRSGTVDARQWKTFAPSLSYLAGDFTDASRYKDLKEHLEEAAQALGSANRLFYLATPPSLYPDIVHCIGEHGLNVTEPGSWTRIVVEKPFGKDLETALALNHEIHSVLSEDQVYRIDHYLGKETVQNILVLRFANGIFEPLWNRNFIDHVEITMAESIGVEGRGGYYEEAGALRDMVQNHMMQLISLISMEPPIAFEAGEVRNEKVKVLRAIRPYTAESVKTMVVRGQYGPGRVEGEPVVGYRNEPGVSPDSNTETFVALKLLIDNWRWAGVPFYIRTGKRLPRRVTEIAVRFKQAPYLLFRDTEVEQPEKNLLVLQIQPEEGIFLQFGAKVPGPKIRIQAVNMDFSYGASFQEGNADAYERLLLDCMLGDATLFTRHDEVETAWSIVTSILEGWSQLDPSEEGVGMYGAGTWGPREAHELMERDGRHWRLP